jgi:diguanylate cyclase (GGDEF)-like protein
MFDSLLGIPNRGQYDTDFPHLCDLATTECPLSLLVVDLDEFKMINDTYGHQAGDEVLKKIARSVNSAIQGKGDCYRYGGDEITVLLPNRDIQAAKAVAEQIRSGIEQLKFELCPERATASIGLTSYPEVTKNVDEVFLDADAMMYKAKDGGGNEVQSAASSEMSQDSARFMRIDIASRLEGVNLWMRLQSGNDRYFSAVITNDSDEDVTVEAITLKKDKVYLSEPSKPRDTDDWKIRKRSSQTITWEARIPPVMRLRTKEPNHQRGQIMEIDIVVWGRVLGRLKTFSHTILALVEYGNSSISEFC